MSRNFVLVTATQAAQNGANTECGGIKKLKRGVTLAEFVAEYLGQLALKNHEILDRDGSKVVISHEGDKVLTWTFTEYSEIELLDAVKHLTRDELLRDLKELLPLKEIGA